jgi:hypothetical protein
VENLNLKILLTIARSVSRRITLSLLGGAKMREYVIILPQEFYEAQDASANEHNKNNFLFFFFSSKSNKEYTTGFT